jgi:hydrogenase expression/formation protein HypD
MVKFLSEFRDPVIAAGLLKRIEAVSTKPVSFMEVCGTHTVAISRNGLRYAVPSNIRLLSGPGCPVCVTANSDIDRMMAITSQPCVIMATFGDMMKVPGSYSSLSEEKAKGADIRVVYSTFNALDIAAANPDKEVVFFGVGFETTTPGIAASIIEAKKRNLKNYSVLSVHKLVPPAMKALLDLGEIKLDGFICPGHVSMVIGTKPYEFIARDYKIPCVITGFEPLDVLESVLILTEMAEAGEARVKNAYKRIVSEEGNPEALAIMDKVFQPGDGDWRGIGVIPGSGQDIREEFADFDARRKFAEVDVPPVKEHKGCQCGLVLRGVIYPYECKLFGKACVPENPVGPCMVSSEGSCAAYYRYDERPACRQARPEAAK